MAKQKPTKMLAILGRSHRTGRWRLASRSSVLAFLGSCHLDMRASFVEDDKLKMKVTVLLGSATFVLPDGAEVRPSGMSLLAGSTVDVLEHAEEAELPMLEIEWTAILGRIRILTHRQEEGAEETAAVTAETAATSTPGVISVAALAEQDPPPAVGFEDLDPVPAVGFEDLEPAPAAVGFEDLEESAVPPPAVGFEDLEESAVPPPAVGFEDLEESAAPPPAVGFEDLEESAAPPPAVGFEDLEESAAPPPAVGFEDLDESAAPPPAVGFEDLDESAAPPAVGFEDLDESAAPVPAVGFEDLG